MHMVLILRLLMLVALAVIAVTPTHAYWAPAAGHHEVSAGHVHGAGSGGLPDHGHDHDEAELCCASVAMQCGSVALAAEARWNPAESLFVDIARVRDQQVGGTGPLPEFEPPPPRG